MDKTVGRIFFILLMLNMCAAQCVQVLFNAFDSNGQALKQAIVGQPFFLEVAIENLPEHMKNSKPTISDAQQAYVRYNGIEMVTINGKTSVKYKYKARIDNPGQYTLGPARVADGTKILKSLPLTVTVVEATTQCALPAATDKGANNAFLRLSTDKTTAVVGEKIKCSLFFYWTSDVLNVAPINHPEAKSAIFGQQVMEGKGSKKINDIDYQYLHITFDVVPQAAGKLVIPAYSVDFAVKSTHPLSRFAMLLGQVPASTKRIYSNSLSLDIQQLPAHKGPVHAIGTYTKFNTRIEPLVAKEGEGMVLTFEIEGDGVIDKNVPLIVPSTMPASFKYYDSKNYAQEQKEYFEYIVQGLEKGQWTIERQPFTFFDTKTKSYKTLYSQPITLMIMPGTSAPSVARNQVKDEKLNKEIDVDNEIKTIVYNGQWQHTAALALPVWLFILVCLVPLGAYAYRARHVHAYSAPLLAKLRGTSSLYKNSFKKIALADQHKNYAQLYAIFIELFAKKYNMDAAQVTAQFMAEQLKKDGLPNALIDQWNLFFNQLTELKFFKKDVTSAQGKEIVQNAYAWVDRLEKIK